VFYWVVKATVGPILRVVWRPKTSGVENLPKRGPAIIAANHGSYMDWLFLPLVSSRKICFLAKSDYFTGKGVKGKLQKAFFAGTGQVPVVRHGGTAAAAALDTGKEVLASGRLLGIFPEGTRSPDGRMYRGRTGVARMALESGVPVIPCGLVGLYEAAPKGRRLPRVVPVEVRIGTPLDFSRYAGQEGDRAVLRAVTDEIMQAVQALSGLECVDRYASSAAIQPEAELEGD